MSELALAVETAGARVGAAIGEVGDDGTIVVHGAVELTRGRRHAEHLAPAIEWLTATTGIDLASLGRVVADVGPGLFTGLRVGVATAAALARTLRIPAVGVCSLDAVAFGLREARRPVAVVLHARAGDVFWATYTPTHAGVQRLSEPQVGSIAAAISDLAAHRASLGSELICAGDGALPIADELHHTLACQVADAAHASPAVADVLRIGLALPVAGPDAAALEPIYLRPPDAQIKWETRHGAHRPPADAERGR